MGGKMKSLYFGKDDDGLPDKYYHADSGSGLDYSLCRNGNIEDSILSEHVITCPTCIDIIQYCKKFKAITDYRRVK
jgi:hypothetical protein